VKGTVAMRGVTWYCSTLVTWALLRPATTELIAVKACGGVGGRGGGKVTGEGHCVLGLQHWLSVVTVAADSEGCTCCSGVVLMSW
jgi:hypothetical protein